MCLNKNIRLFFLLVVLHIGSVLHAQDPIFSQFFASPLTVNPALAGNGDANWRLVGIRRNQWISAGTDPLNTTSLSFDGKLYKNKYDEHNYIGGGLLFLQDNGLAGAYKSSSFNFALSSHLSLDADDVQGISAGIGGTYSNTIIDFSQLSFASQLSSSGFNRTLPTNEAYMSSIKPYYSAFAGITYTLRTETTNFDIGIAGYRFFRTAKSALQDANQFDPPRYNVHADFQTYLNDRLVFNANSMLVFENNINSYSVGVNFGNILGDAYTEGNPTILNTGLWYRQHEAVIPYIGLGVGNVLGGLSYDVNISNSKNTIGPLQTFEFSLIYRSPSRSRSTIPCPWR